MPNQPATKRLLTEATAALSYRTAAQVDTAADNRIGVMLTAQKAKPSGLASLGADGLVPTAQLPAVAAPRQVVKTTETMLSGVTQTPTAVTEMALAGVPAGVYALDGVLWCNVTSGANTAIRWNVAASAGLVLAANSFVGDPVSTAGQGFTVAGGAGYVVGATVTAARTTTATNLAEPRQLAGSLRVTTGGTLTLNAAPHVANNLYVQPGSWLRLTAIG